MSSDSTQTHQMLKLVGVDGEVENGDVGDQIEKSSKSEKSAKLVNIGKLAKSKKSSKVKESEGPSFLNPNTRLVFTRLRQVFTEVPILRHFDPERHILIETDASRYTIGGVLNQLTSDHLTTDLDSSKSDFGQ